MAKKGWFWYWLYLAAVIFLPSLLGWTTVPWPDAPLRVFAGEFSNFIPLRGVLGAISAGSLSALGQYGLHLILMVPVGLLSRKDCEKPARVCGMYALILCGLYALRLLLKLGSFDVDDILMNLIGIFVGMLLAKSVKRVKG